MPVAIATESLKTEHISVRPTDAGARIGLSFWRQLLTKTQSLCVADLRLPPQNFSCETGH